MLKLDLYCVGLGRDQFQPCAVVQPGLQFLWLLCGGKEAFGVLVYRIVYQAQAGPYTDRTMRKLAMAETPSAGPCIFGACGSIKQHQDVNVD